MMGVYILKIFGINNTERIGKIKWCERRDSNSHGLPRWNLNPVRLPISPLSQG